MSFYVHKHSINHVTYVETRIATEMIDSTCTDCYCIDELFSPGVCANYFSKISILQ